MKKIIFMIIIVLMLFGCTEKVVKEEKTDSIEEIPEFQSFIIEGSDVKGVAEEDLGQSKTGSKTFVIRVVDQGFSPEEITVNKGDRVGIYLTNMINNDDLSGTRDGVDDDLEEGIRSGTREGYDTGSEYDNEGEVTLVGQTIMFSDVSTFSITGHNIEDFYERTGTIYIEFVADKTGEFDFGDDRKNTRKGKLIVI